MPTPPPAEPRTPLPVWLAIAASGLAVGALSVAFHVALDLALEGREWLTAHLTSFGVGGMLILAAVCAAAVALAVWLTERFAPQAAGSGIQHVEGVVRERLGHWPLSVLWVKFVGGVVGIGGGLFLGREGPTVQMGASLADRLGGWLGLVDADRRTLLVIGAGAGLAGAFNAPLAGTLLVVEELGGRFVPVVVLGTLLAAATTDLLVRISLGQIAELALPIEVPPPLVLLLPAVGMGVAGGAFGCFFDGALLRTLDLVARWKARVPSWALAAALGALLGLVGWALPALPGGGTDFAAHVLRGGTAPDQVAWLLPLAFAMTLASYAIGAPGGIFAPLLVLGALLGVSAHAGWLALAPGTGAPLSVFAATAMAALFAGIVRSPFTGAVLLIEMTGAYALALPLVAASLTANGVAAALGGRPVYDSLLERELRRAEVRPTPQHAPGDAA